MVVYVLQAATTSWQNQYMECDGCFRVPRVHCQRQSGWGGDEVECMYARCMCCTHAGRPVPHSHAISPEASMMWAGPAAHTPRSKDCLHSGLGNADPLLLTNLASPLHIRAAPRSRWLVSHVPLTCPSA